MSSKAKPAKGLRALLPRLRRDRRGNLATVVAVLSLPLIGFTALAVDFSAATQARSQLDLAADEAVMAAVNAAASAYAANPLATFTAAQDLGIQRFTGVATRMRNLTLQPVTLTVTRNGATFNGSITYSAARPTALAQVLGRRSLTISNTITSSLTSGPYVDIQILFDISASMMIAASPTDIANMVRFTTQPLARGDTLSPNQAYSYWNACAFACHWDSQNRDFYGIALRHGIRLRMDDLKSAISTIITNLSARNQLNTYRAGLYTFTTGLTQAAALTGTLSNVATAAANTTPPLLNYFGGVAAANTNLTTSVRAFNTSYLANAGDGSNAAAPKKYVFLLTDGVEDYMQGGSRRESAMNVAACTEMKNKGAVVMVLHTLYYNPNGMFNEISAIQNQVTTALQACASSPGLYFPVSDTASINTAMTAMLNLATAQPARFTR